VYGNGDMGTAPLAKRRTHGGPTGKEATHLYMLKDYILQDVGFATGA
jgi:hypothetical protein